ncbi:MAG: hypothetical protein ACRD2G_11915, partial [Terriglobia bacterium]
MALVRVLIISNLLTLKEHNFRGIAYNSAKRAGVQVISATDYDRQLSGLAAALQNNACGVVFFLLSPNTVHLTILMHSEILIRTLQQA